MAPPRHGSNREQSFGGRSGEEEPAGGGSGGEERISGGSRKELGGVDLAGHNAPMAGGAQFDEDASTDGQLRQQ